MLLSKVKTMFSWPLTKQRNETPALIHQLPDEMLLQIFNNLNAEELLCFAAEVCKRWQRLSTDPKLWHTRSVIYDPHKPNVLRACLRHVSELRCLHLGGHEALHENILKIFSASVLKSVKKLEFLSSCRTSPEYVVLILKTLSPALESLTICLNDELVSYGCDKKTCYSVKRNTLNRPGILFKVIAEIENLRHLTLRGGYSTTWYHNEINKSPGCNQLETLDLRDFQEIFYERNFTQKTTFVEALILKNKSTLMSLKLTTTRDRDRDAILECKENLLELEICAARMTEMLDQMTSLSKLHINGRCAMSRASQQEIASFISTSRVMGCLKELSLVQFNDPHNIILSAVASNCTQLKIFRSESNVLRGKGITALIKSAILLEEVYVPYTYVIADRHLALIPIYLPNLVMLDLTGNGFMNCMVSIQRLQKKGNDKLKILGVSCDCSFPHKEGSVGQDSDISYDDDYDNWRLQGEADDSD